MARTFFEKLRAKWNQGKFLCVGLDTDWTKIPTRISIESGNDPADAVRAFNKAIIKSTHDIVCAYKPNMAFYEALGSKGVETLMWTISDIKDADPDMPIVLDFKRGDNSVSNLGYVAEAFDFFEVDAVTVHPYMGQEALQPFLDRRDKGIFVLCRTSNPGAGEFQDLRVAIGMGGRITAALYEVVAARVAQNWNANGNCGLVVGATAPEELAKIRSIDGVDALPILIPGIGAQGGDLRASVLAGKSGQNKGIIVNISREALFASKGDDFADAARTVTLNHSNEINTILNG